MRLLRKITSLFKPHFPATRLGEKLAVVKAILEPHIDELCFSVKKDIEAKRIKGKMWNLDRLNNGMPFDTVLKTAVLQAMNDWTFDQLKEHVDDSMAARAFLCLDDGETSWSRSCLHENVSAISEATWKEIDKCILSVANSQEIERGRMVRVDSTVIETNIHHPTDSSLLRDCIRVLWFFLKMMRKSGSDEFKSFYLGISWKKVKQIHLQIINSKNDEERKEPYRQLVFMAKEALKKMNYISSDLEKLKHKSSGTKLRKIEQVLSVLEVLPKIIWQTEQRVLKGRQVPVKKKIISIFEEHSDIIVKGRRETEFGHKVFFTSGKSGLVTGVRIERGNPSDHELFLPMIEDQEKLYNRPPRQISADGGFASAENVAKAKEIGVSDVAFSKRCGLEVEDMTKSQWVFDKLRNFRAGIEGNISTLKRAYGLSRATWKGWDGFRKYVISSVVGYNIAKLALLTE